MAASVLIMFGPSGTLPNDSSWRMQTSVTGVVVTVVVVTVVEIVVVAVGVFVVVVTAVVAALVVDRSSLLIHFGWSWHSSSSSSLKSVTIESTWYI